MCTGSRLPARDVEQARARGRQPACYSTAMQSAQEGEAGATVPCIVTHQATYMNLNVLDQMYWIRSFEPFNKI